MDQIPRIGVSCGQVTVPKHRFRSFLRELLKSHTVYSEYRERQKKERHLAKGLYLSVAFAANIGGTATLTSAGPNLILKFIMDEYVGMT